MTFYKDLKRKDPELAKALAASEPDLVNALIAYDREQELQGTVHVVKMGHVCKMPKTEYVKDNLPLGTVVRCECGKKWELRRDRYAIRSSDKTYDWQRIDFRYKLSMIEWGAVIPALLVAGWAVLLIILLITGALA